MAGIRKNCRSSPTTASQIASRHLNPSTAIYRIHPPPRLILGVSLLFWGEMTDRLMLGGILALIVESFRWLRIRWDFDDDACALAWKLTTLVILFTGVVIYLDGPARYAMPKLFSWLPVLLLPMQFVQSMGVKNSMPLITFSFLAKQRRLRNFRLGLSEEMIHVNFGNIYFVATLVAATLGSSSGSRSFLPGVIILTGWMLLSASRSRPTSLIISLIFAGGIAVAGQRGMDELYEWLGNRSATRSGFDPDSKETMIGRQGTVVQSPDIVWRLRTENRTLAPHLLRTASYNTFGSSSWKIDPETAQVLRDLDTVTSNGNDSYISEQYPGTTDPLLAVAKSLPRYQLRGAAMADTPLPLPGAFSSLTGFELDGAEHNALGTVLVSPKQAVIDGSVAWNGETTAEFLPLDEDLKVPHLEHDALREVLAEIQLDAIPNLDGKLEAIQNWFQKNFKYTRELKIVSSPHVSQRPTALTQFLTTVRAGHCEYFAAATTLLLREAKIPARYSIGYAVFELDKKRDEYVIRGTHGHAWVRVWDEAANHWRDFDTTPSTWIPMVGQIPPAMQPFNDAIKRLREDFLIWRNRPANRLGVTLVMSAIALGVIGFVFKRLWKSRQRLEAIKRSNGYEGTILRTPLNALEKPLAKHLGPRPLGRPLAQWITDLKPALPTTAILDEALEIHQRLRFDPAPSIPADEARLAELARQLESSLKRTL